MESFGSIIPKVIENRKLKFFNFHKIRIKKTGNVPKLINDLRTVLDLAQYKGV